MSQIDFDGDWYKNSLHIPKDAGEQPDRLRCILLRYPMAGGRWIRHSKSWYPLIVDLDTALSEIDPNYDVLQVKIRIPGVLLRSAHCQRGTAPTDAGASRCNRIRIESDL